MVMVMTEKGRYYSKHKYCYQYNILDSEKQDGYGDDMVIGAANGNMDAADIVKRLNEQEERIKDY